MPVCSKPAGNTVQGLCDMAGNVWQWVQDKHQNSYHGAPVDGTAFEGSGRGRVIRGGSFHDASPRLLLAVYRYAYGPGSRINDLGFRVARSR